MGNLLHRRKAFRGQSYYQAVLADNPVAYWRLGESSGTTASDEMGSYDATYTNTPTLGATSLIAGESDTAVTFANASSEYAEISSNLGITAFPFTLEAWIKTSTTQEDVIVSLSNSASSSQWYAITVDTGGLANTYARNGSLNKGVGTTTVNDTSIYHIVGVFVSATERLLYVNGSLEDTATTSITFTTMDTASIGRFGDATPSSYMDGTIDDVAVYDTELSSTRILAHYSAGS